MSLKDHFPPPADARWASDFAMTHFRDMSVEEFFAQEKFSDFMASVKSGTWSDLAKEYSSITGEDVRSSTTAVLIAKSL